jgi:parvulin-like peptidyl-prolyl isomerase
MPRLSLPLLLPVAALAAGAAPAAPKARPAAPAKPAPAKAGPMRPSQLPPGSTFVAVNGEAVTISNYVDRLSLAFAPQMREILVEEALVRQEAKRRKLAAAAAEVTAVVAQVYGETARRYGGEKNLEKELQSTRGWSLADYKVVIREQAVAQVLRQKIAADLVKDAAVTDADVAKLYDERKMNFTVADTISISHILVRRPGETEPEQDRAARARAEDMLKQLKGGKPFEELALSASDDKITGARGGKVPTDIVRGAHPFGDAFEAVVFNAPPGLVGEVVPSPLGFHLVRVDGKKAGRLLPLEEVREQIKQSLLGERRQRAMEELFVRLRTTAKVDTGRF